MHNASPSSSRRVLSAVASLGMLAVISLPSVALAEESESPQSGVEQGTIDTPTAPDSENVSEPSTEESPETNTPPETDTPAVQTPKAQALEIVAPMNFAVNLAAGSSPEQLASLADKVQSQGNVVLTQYPQFSTFFAQSNRSTFVADVKAAAAELGIAVDSVGPTRQAAVTGEELKVAAPEQPALQSLRMAVSGAISQLEREAALSQWEPDPLTLANVWGVQAIGALEAQEVDVPLEPVTVAVLDTGIDGTHEDLKDQIDVSRSVGCDVNGIADTSWSAWQDNHYHGTHVAGTIAASHNEIGVDGVAPAATLVSVRTGNADGFFYPEYVACAFTWVAEHNIDITNNSYYVDPWAFWVPTEENQKAGYEAVRRAVEYSQNNGVVNIAAAGNSDYDLSNLTVDNESPNDLTKDDIIRDRDVTGGFDLPTQLPGVVSVSAVQSPSFRSENPANPMEETLTRSGFSNYGEDAITVAAPGSTIASTVPMNQGAYSFLSGTSMASPHVAGVAALIKSIHPDFTADQTIALLQKQAGYTYDRLAAPTDGKEYRGAGLVNALAAVTKDQPQPTIDTVEYSQKGSSWKPLANAKVSGEVTIRATISGPVTEATLTLGDETAKATGSGAFDETITVSITADFSALTKQAPQSLSVQAYGRNKSEAADDDISAEVSFSADPVPASPAVPEKDKAPAAKAKDTSLASTGANLGLLGLAATALVVGAGLITVRRISAK